MTTIVVLVKDFAMAKQRLSRALDHGQRHQLAVANAQRALGAAHAVGPVIAVCSSAEAADLAGSTHAEVILEPESRGQNPAAATGIAAAVARGATSVLVLSSDLPLVDVDGLDQLLSHGRDIQGPLLLAAPAIGRGGTNALLLRPPQGIELQFGDASLRRFEREAGRTGRTFAVHDDPRLALDIDDEEDLARLAELRAPA